MSETIGLSSGALAVLHQLFAGPVWDGDLVEKQGRTELVKLGLAQRCRTDERGLAINELSDAGREYCKQAIDGVDAAFAMAMKRVDGMTVH